jgi:enoyl-CoA hydratase/carnithine racemase
MGAPDRGGGELSGAAIGVSLADRVMTIELQRPARKNAFTWSMLEPWAAAYEEAAADPGVGAVVLTGAGDAFCSGVDLEALSEIDDTPLAHKKMLTDRVHRVAQALTRLEKPVIAAVNGVAVGAGMDMALMCDMRFASRTARFSEGYIRLGLVPGDGGCWFLPRLVGIGKALELLLSGDFIEAEEAHRIGLVNRLYESEELLGRTQEFAARLAASPPVAIQMIKRATYQSLDLDLFTSLDLISSHMGVVMASEATAELVRTQQAKGNHGNS